MTNATQAYYTLSQEENTGRCSACWILSSSKMVCACIIVLHTERMGVVFICDEILHILMHISHVLERKDARQHWRAEHSIPYVCCTGVAYLSA